jgi:hypothetical protein
LEKCFLIHASEDNAEAKPHHKISASSGPNQSDRQKAQGLDEFDKLLNWAIEKTISYIFGDINAQVIYSYLEKKECGLKQIPAKLTLFSVELRRILGTGRGQLLGAAPILEEAILETLCSEMQIKFDESEGKSFADRVERIRESYNKSTKTGSILTQALSSEDGDEDTAGRKHRSLCSS